MSSVRMSVVEGWQVTQTVVEEVNPEKKRLAKEICASLDQMERAKLFPGGYVIGSTLICLFAWVSAYLFHLSYLAGLVFGWASQQYGQWGEAFIFPLISLLLGRTIGHLAWVAVYRERYTTAYRSLQSLVTSSSEHRKVLVEINRLSPEISLGVRKEVLQLIGEEGMNG